MSSAINAGMQPIAVRNVVREQGRDDRTTMRR
jgi:hypothetical protein